MGKFLLFFYFEDKMKRGIGHWFGSGVEWGSKKCSFCFDIPQKRLYIIRRCDIIPRWKN
jgi:hypothetical protein